MRAEAALSRDSGTNAASVYRVPGWYARIPHGWVRALAQLAVPSSVRAVLDAVAEIYTGLDAARAQREGVAITVRAIADRYGLHPTHVQRGMAWALAHGLLGRRPDPEHPGCYRYALTHPSAWSPTPMSGHGLAQVRVEGWDAVLLDVTVGTAEAPKLSTGPVGNPAEAVHTDRHASRARSSSEDQREEKRRSIVRNSSLARADAWYVWTGSGANRARVAVTWWITEQLEARWPIAFEVLAGRGRDAAPAWIVVEFFEALSGVWSPESLAVLIRKVWRVVEHDAAGRRPQGDSAQDQVGGVLDRRVGDPDGGPRRVSPPPGPPPLRGHGSGGFSRRVSGRFPDGRRRPLPAFPDQGASCATTARRARCDRRAQARGRG